MDTRLALRVARGQVEQQATIDRWLGERQITGTSANLAIVAQGAFFELVVPPEVPLQRLAAGCVCCVGLLPLQVTLTRLLRAHRPRSLLLLVSDAAHLDRVRTLVASGKLGVLLEEG
jgi:hypothetical protein